MSAPPIGRWWRRGSWPRSSIRNGCATSPAAWAWKPRPTGSTPGLIARYGAVMRPAATLLPDPARVALGEILACRRQLVDEITVRKQQLEHLQSEDMRARVTRAMVFLRQEERELAQRLRQKIQADAALAADFALLTSMPGCGLILAATLLAEMPELGALDRRAVASLVGLAPVARNSGLREHRRVIKGGHGQVRRAPSTGPPSPA